MNKLIVLITCFLCLVGPAKVAESNGKGVRIPFYILNAASQFNIDADLMYALCRVESNCNPKAVNHSDGTPAQKAAGMIVKSYGLFQIQLSTAEDLGFISKETLEIDRIRHHKIIKVKKTIDHTKELLNPATNSYYAAMLLAHLYHRYGDTERVISAYNAGRYIKSNKDYVYKVLLNYTRNKIDRR